MAAIDWPMTLPPHLVGSLREGRLPAYMDDPAETGPPRRRKRFTRTLRKFMFELMLIDTTAGYLRTFVDTTTDGGVLAFDWTHPTIGELEVRFATLPEIPEATKGAYRVPIELQEV